MFKGLFDVTEMQHASAIRCCKCNSGWSLCLGSVFSAPRTAPGVAARFGAVPSSVVLYPKVGTRREFCTLKRVVVRVQQPHRFLLLQPKTYLNNYCIGTRLYFYIRHIRTSYTLFFLHRNEKPG